MTDRYINTQLRVEEGGGSRTGKMQNHSSEKNTPVVRRSPELILSRVRVKLYSTKSITVMASGSGLVFLCMHTVIYSILIIEI